MIDDDAPALPSYAQNPRPIGMHLSYTLDGRELVVNSFRKVDRVQLGAVTDVRVSYEPRSLAQSMLKTRIKLKGGKTLTFTSISYRSMTNIERQDAAYGAFLRTLLPAIAREAPGVRFHAGRPPVLWYATIALAAVTLVSVTLFTLRADQAGSTWAALFGLAVAALGIWQIEPLVRLNKPREFRPDEPPRDLVP